ncbi:MAG: UbiA family prenyltransferase [Clostridiales bacterium]|jgi:4-hydroxybenzoate polyprenyltransferase|nr:UbiA family prenyltransferase [Clostridiales bacterium]
MKKWYIYQKERFPLLQYIPMMAAFGFCAVSYSIHLDNPDAHLSDISLPQYITAVITTLIWFMLMRIADEHKDFEEDSLYRPYRPVQRSLITLKELRFAGLVLVLIQIALSLWIDLRLAVTLVMVYFWFALMSFEFFVPKWLKTHHTTYLASHMIIMPFIDLFATSIEWVPRGGAFSYGLLVYMISSFCDGTVVEVGRKLRAKENEEYGVDTYTQIWGPKRAMAVWMVCMTISGVSTVLAGFQVSVGFEILAVLSLLYIFAAYVALRFAKEPSPENAKVFEIFPGVWMLLMYFMLGVLPFFK